MADTTQPIDTSSTVPAPAPVVPKTPLLSIERVVALLTPVFAGAAGWLFTALGKAIPGIDIPHDQFVTLFVGGAVLATTASLTWLFGRQKFVHFTLGAEAVTDHVAKAIQDNFPQGVPQLRQIQAALEAHEAAVTGAVAQLLPPAVAAPVEEAISTVEQPTVEQPTLPAEAAAPAQ